MTNDRRLHRLEMLASMEAAKSRAAADDAVAAELKREFGHMTDAEIEALVMESRPDSARVFLAEGDPRQWPGWADTPGIYQEVLVESFEAWKRGDWNAIPGVVPPADAT
jgi:hypothetical protein